MNSINILDEFFQRCEDEEIGERTIKNSKRVLIPFLEWAQDREIIPKLVNEYIKVLKTHTFKRNRETHTYCDTTIYHHKMILKKFLNFISPEMGKEIKLKTQNNKEPPQILTPAEIEKLIDAALSTRDKALIAFLYESGCRKGELLSIRIENITFNEHGALVTIPKGKTGSRTIQVV